jgi:tryptophanyl-tRNA synthetase
MADAAYIDKVLADGAARASLLAGETMKSVKDIIGFIHR